MKNAETRPHGSPSIRLLLTVWYSLTVALLLTMIVLLLYWVSCDVTERANRDFMRDQVATLQTLLADPVAYKKLLQKNIVESPFQTRDSVYRYYVRVFSVDPRGAHLFMETPGMSRLLPVTNTQQVSASSQGDVSFEWGRSDRHFPVLRWHNKHWRIEILLDTSNQNAITHEP